MMHIKKKSNQTSLGLFYAIFAIILYGSILQGCTSEIVGSNNPPISEDLVLQKFDQISNNAKRTLLWNPPLSAVSPSFRLVLAKDRTCKDFVFEYKTTITTTDISLPTEGEYYVCLFADDANGKTFTSPQNGLPIAFDATAPAISVDETIFIRDSGNLVVTVIDQSSVRCEWESSELKLNPGASDRSVHAQASRDGQFFVDVTCTDSASNSTSRNLKIVSDTVPPKLEKWAVKPPKILATTADPDAYEIQVSPGATCLDASSWQAYEDNLDISSINVDGPLSIRVRDRVGNTGSCKKIAMLFGKTAPLPPSLIHFKSLISGLPFSEVRWTAASDSQTVSYRSKLCQEADCKTHCSDTHSSKTLAVKIPTDDGRFYACVQSVNELGLESPWIASSAGVVVDTLAPVVNVGMDRVSGAAIMIEPTVAESNPFSFIWSQVSGPTGGTITFDSATGKNTSLKANKDGDYVVRLTATDALGRSHSDDFVLYWSYAASFATTGGRTCRIYDDGLRCWGENYHGLSLNTGNSRALFAPPSKPISFAKGQKPSLVRLSSTNTCIISSLGEVSCWGNDAAFLGDGSTEITGVAGAKTVALGLGRTAIDLNLGAGFACATLDDRSVKCWGRNDMGQLGNGTTTSTSLPSEQPVALSRKVKKLSTGMYSSCAILDDGSVSCWGNGLVSQLATGNNTDQLTPQPGFFPAGKKAIRVSGRDRGFCALTEDYAVYCWGSNDFGQAGLGYIGHVLSLPNQMRPVNFDAGRKPVDLFSFTYTSCAILDTGEVTCWGQGNGGQRGVLPAADGSLPGPAIDFGVGRKVLSGSVAFNANHSCVLLDNLKLKCWGPNSFGEQGMGDAQTSPYYPTTYVNFGPGRTVLAVQTGVGSATCAILDGHELKCWGQNSSGQLGLGDTVNRGLPDAAAIDLGLGRSARSVSVGGSHVCAILDDFTARCWGNNFYGQLGHGNTTATSSPSTSPVLSFGGTSGARKILAGNSHTCAIRLDGELYCWGRNGHLELGTLGGNRHSPIPVNLGAGEKALDLAFGNTSTCVLLESGTIKCFGRNDGGTLGRGSEASYSSEVPTAVDLGVGQKAVSISAGFKHVCAILESGHSKCWGPNTGNQLGLIEPMTVPAPLPDPIDFLHGRKPLALQANNRGTCVLLDDNTGSCFGGTGSGMIGNGLIENGQGFRITEPIIFQEPVLTLSSRGTHVCALFVSKQIKCWGYNNNGQLGYGLPKYYNVPDLTREIELSP